MLDNDEISLFLPDGFGKGTIIYDINNNPYEAVEAVVPPVYKVVAVDAEYAKQKIKQGAKTLSATKS